MNKRIKKKHFSLSVGVKEMRTEVVLDDALSFYTRYPELLDRYKYISWRFYLKQYNFNKRHTKLTSFHKRESYYYSRWSR